MQAKLNCNSFRGSPIHYNLVITDSDDTNLSFTEVNLNDCMDTTCSVTVSTKFLTSLSIQLSLTAVNVAGTSIYLPKPQICELKQLLPYKKPSYLSPCTDQTSAWYYRPQITFINCSALQVSCTISKNVDDNTTCTIYYYGADSNYEQILSTKRFSKGETTKILIFESTKTTVHYLAFHLSVSSTFEINDQFVHSISDFSCLQGGIICIFK